MCSELELCKHHKITVFYCIYPLVTKNNQKQQITKSEIKPRAPQWKLFAPSSEAPTYPAWGLSGGPGPADPSVAVCGLCSHPWTCDGMPDTPLGILPATHPGPLVLPKGEGAKPG